MQLLDWIVIGLFFIALIGIIVWVMRQKQNNAADYFLGGKDATWIAIGASIFASNIGSEHLIGLAGAGKSDKMLRAYIGRENRGTDGNPGCILSAEEVVGGIVLLLPHYPYDNADKGDKKEPYYNPVK